VVREGRLGGGSEHVWEACQQADTNVYYVL